MGGAACEGLAQRGFSVLVVDLDGDRAQATADRITAAGGTASSFAADVSDADAVAGYVAACVERYGAPRAFFNNAAFEGAIAPITEYPLDIFDRTMAINVRGVFLGLKHVIPAMRERGGSIVNVSSQAGIRGVPNLSAYSASKHAVVGLSRGAALEEAPGIRINCVCPGPTDTRMMADIEATVRAQGGDPSGFVDNIPVGRYGRPEEIAAFVVWLLAEAPEFLTGAVLPIDGGMTTP
ncbi:SDR family oxidoreductase [Baekduia soli]|uniref:SDR family oxidoreductase n=1 Tax=Baekduia soli TaxID=496014 RepID=A0A5B8U5Y1_9ACTN|nr:SDR family NAD(P)-dependent oxidoreductase [Baekduia soli]QEC48397.1 SDR family oxidoreductase [Baekduia soli]